VFVFKGPIFEEEARLRSKKTDMNASHTDLLHKITFDSLQTPWAFGEEVGVVVHRMPVPAAVKAIAVELGVSVKSLSQRMRDVEFDRYRPICWLRSRLWFGLSSRYIVLVN
jgi:replicative DNA helicase